MRAVFISREVFILRYNNLMKRSAKHPGVFEGLNNVPVWGWILLIALMGVGWKCLFLITGAFPFNSDEAITGLMARHILLGERPIFFYGQAYMGSLDAFLSAGLFALLGESILPIRIVQTILYTCTIITTAFIGRKLTDDWKVGLLGSLFVAIPTVNVTLYTTVSLGGYGEALLFANLAFLIVFYMADCGRLDITKDIVLFGLLAFVTGVGFWAFGISLSGTLPASIYGLILIWRRWRKKRAIFAGFLIAFLVFFIIGSFPWWLAGLNAGIGIQLRELAGSAVSIEKGNWILRTGSHLFNFIFLGLPAVFGFRPPWEIRWLVLPLLPFVLFGWGLVFWRFPSEFKKANQLYRERWLVLLGSMLLLAAGFLFTSFGLDPSGRYFLPLVVPFSLIAAHIIISAPISSSIRSIVIILLLSFHGIGTVQAAMKNPPGITTQFDPVSWIDHQYDQELMVFLRENDEGYGYSNYWVAYPLAFQSGEELIFPPRLPYHTDFRYTTRDDRIPAYTLRVENSSKTAYITTFNPDLDTALRSGFERLDVTWQEKVIGDYHIYYDLSRPVHPSELNPELQQQPGIGDP